MNATSLQVFDLVSAAIRVLRAHGLKHDCDAVQTWPGDAEQQAALEELVVAVCQILPPEGGGMRLTDTGKGMGGWQPIRTAPRDGTEILLCEWCDADGRRLSARTFGIYCQVAAWWGEGDAGEWVVYCSLPREPRLHFDPTHWMPLPEGPKSEV